MLFAPWTGAADEAEETADRGPEAPDAGAGESETVDPGGSEPEASEPETADLESPEPGSAVPGETGPEASGPTASTDEPVCNTD